MDSKLVAHRSFWIVALFLTTSMIAFAHPPKRPVLELNATNTALTICVDHSVRGGQTHFIERIIVSVNGKQITAYRLKSQPDLAGYSNRVRLSNLSPGDKISVKVTCNVFGWRSAEMIVPEAKPSEEKEPKLKTSKELLKVGVEAPVFKLKDEKGKVIDIKKFRGKKNIVFVFYPGDNTPGCTKQLCAIRDDFALFSDAETVVFGINPQSAKSHTKFVDKFDFPFSLLIDEDKRVVGAYGCAGLLMTKRTVYAIDKKGTIVFAKRGMPANKDILAALKKTEARPK